MPIVLIPLAFLLRSWRVDRQQSPDSAELDSTPIAPASPANSVASSVVASESYPYREHGDGRVVSEVGIELIAHDTSTTELQLEARSVGPLVEPPRGWSWVRGENPITAREMLLVTDDERTKVLTRNVETNEEIPGEVELGEFGHFTERILQSDGSVVDAGQSKAPLPKAMQFRSGPLPIGSYVTELVVDGISRLRVDFEFDGETGRISNIESGHPEEDKVGTP